MKNILDNIILRRRHAIDQLKEMVPIDTWETMPLFNKKCISMKGSLCNDFETGIVAEFKRASPTRGILNNSADVYDVVSDYQMHGASGVSIVTEPYFYRGHIDDILNVAESLSIPILRKDYIIDEYQVIESKALGTDIILLIASCLSRTETRHFASLAHQLGMEVMLEVHDEKDLAHLGDDIDIICVNNRDPGTFEIDLRVSFELSEKIASDICTVSESGIRDVRTIRMLESFGFSGFLIGERFMSEADPGMAFERFVNELKVT